MTVNLVSGIKLLLYFVGAFLSCGSTQDSPKVSAFKAFEVSYSGSDFDVVRVDPKEADIQLFLENKSGDKFRSFRNLKTELEAKGLHLCFAMNGGMYLKDGTPQGLYIEDGKLIKVLDTIQEAYGNFYLQPNGIFYIQNKKASVSTTKDFQQINPNPDFATQSGPMLVIDNAIHPAFTEGSKNIHIRNGVGIDSEGKVFFAISKNKLNLFDFGMLFKEKLLCKNALYLDGFVSRAYIPDLKRYDLDGNFGVIICITTEN